ncbi:Protein kinase superfamily protein with octicosapeptide/Phox/Bem1p domain [Forsythia ovata]|uniref:Protein kinase superfamily protein with octicosapeptide/Phox/Bem1p domain n=1 Tax=Forsythia ovata TaxID=205694 RepID=A0ABD1PKE7_9LAMI
MGSPAETPGSAPSSNDENPRVKFLCSFSGSILPRPQDGKLRYVGGETRIVSVPRNISYEDLMGRMRELFEGATVLKYQQPDEDLDALVSVVNDDDVTNMMEEYDKLGLGDGFTRLRIFLFSNPDQDGSVNFGDGDERDNERRYVDALNNLNETPEIRKQSAESMEMEPLDDLYVTEQYFNQMNLEVGLHGQRNPELSMPPINLRHLTIPHLGSGLPQMEAPWSPAYYSPRQPGHLDQRPVVDIPPSPSSVRYRTPYGEFLDKSFDRMPEEHNRPPMHHQPIHEQQPQYTENLVLIPTGSVASERAGFPGNILHGHNVYEGNSICEHCRMTFQRNQVYPDSLWKPGEQPHLEPPSLGNGYHAVPNSCPECPPNKEMYMLNTDANTHHPYCSRGPTDPRSPYNETHGHERGQILLHQSIPRPEDLHVSVPARPTEHYIVDNGSSIPLGHGNICDGHHVQSPYIHREDPRYVRAGADFGSQVFQDQALASGSQIHVPTHAHGADNLYQVPHSHIHAHALWRNAHSPLQGVPSGETSVSPQLPNGCISNGFLSGAVEGNPSLRTGLDNQIPWGESSRKVVGTDGSLVPEYPHGQIVNLISNTCPQENQLLCTLQPTHSATDMTKFANSVNPLTKFDSELFVDDKLFPQNSFGLDSINDTDVTESVRIEGNGVHEGCRETNLEAADEDCNKPDAANKNLYSVVPIEYTKSNQQEHAVESCFAAKEYENNASAPEELPDERLSFLPELMASAKKAALEGVKEVKDKVQVDAGLGIEPNAVAKEDAHNVTDVDGTGDLEMDSDNDNVNNTKIEPTKAEAEAIDNGLQTIKNEDLEEIRELGSGTYGSVYHGKWKGSDVAIKRIKASCFAGKPSERERLIADFWKEALILSSLHHPNVVSFYGVVRDGPDGSLATVTEFMVNGSLKQFLQKKDRTIDRRKRLIIAMDAAFGMEYLHGKDIVHFDLKCENLLVNMRDPHRPVCKIGDLGLSKVKQHTLVSGGVRGTLPWMAPELLSGKSNMVTEKIDVYSFGIVMWELLTGDEPYADMHCASIIGGIVNNTLRPQIPTWCDPEWKSLMESCWASDPAQRPSFSKISQKLRNMAAAMNLK